MIFVFYLIILLTGLQFILGLTELTNRNFISFNPEDFDEVETLLTQFKLTFVEKITSSLYIYKYNGTHLEQSDIDDIKVASNGKVINIDVIKQHQIEFPDVIYTESTSSTPSTSYSTTTAEKQETVLPCHGMGIDQAWKAGYNGSGIIVAVCDVGVDVDIQDLEPNINIELSHNFVDNNSDVHQVHYRSYVKSFDLTDHGNNCAGLIAAVRGNDICTSGIAYGSKIAVLKIATIKEQKWQQISDDYIVEALNWHLQEIDIYSNSWQYNKTFVGLDRNQLETLSFGTRCGRNRKGSLYVFPAGSIAEGFSNSIYTIAVSSFNPYGGKPDFVENCACTLTSTYGEGTNYGVPYMKTTSYPHGCKSDFKGTSASTAMLSAIVALALQANKNLTWRDIQHLIVTASDYKGHAETQNFKMNDAGHHFHNLFGFGLMNANTFVKLAVSWKGVRSQRNIAICSDQCKKADCFQQYKRYAVWKRFVQVDCDNTEVCCISKVEHVIVTISYKSSNETRLGIVITSPGKTVSILMRDGQSKVKGPTERTNAQFLSVHFWNENPLGKWELSLREYKFKKENQNAFEIISFELSIMGTTEDNSSHCQYAEDDKEDCSRNTKSNRPIVTTTIAPQTKYKDHNINYFIIGIVVGLCIVCVGFYITQRNNNIATQTEEHDETLLTNRDNLN